MKSAYGWILWLLLALTCEAAEIVAWKVPLDRFTERGLGSSGIVLCKAAPEPSPFFKPGDVLWDLKGIPAEERIQTEPPLDWIVWNETSESLVIKADWNAIWQLHLQLKMDELPMHCRVTAEVFEVPADGSPFSEKSVPSMALSWISRSAECEALHQQEGKLIRLKSNATIDQGASVVDLKLGISISLPDQPELNLDTALILRSGSSLWAARDFDGKKGMDLRISASIELPDGTPFSHALMIQKGDAVSPIVADHMQMQKHRVGDKGWLISSSLHPVNLADLVLIYDPSEKDPFTAEVPKTVRKPDCFKEVMVPEILKPWFSGPVWDLREWVRKHGFDLKDEKDFVGYDPLTQKIFILSESEHLLDYFVEMWSSSCCGRHYPSMVIATFDGVGQTRLVSYSGQKCHLKRTIADQKEIRFFEIQPTVGESNQLIDFPLVFRDTSVAQRNQSLNTAATLRSGRTLELISGGHGEVKDSLRVKGEVIDVP